MTDFNRCKFFIPGLNRCENPTMEESDLCCWHNSFYWDSESFNKLSEIGFKALGFVLIGMNLSEVSVLEGDFRSASLRQTELNSCFFINSSFQNANLEESYFANTKFESCNLRDSLWQSCEMAGGEFRNSDLSGIRFKNTIIRQISTKQCLLAKLRVEQSLLESMDFGSCEWICENSYEQNIFPRFVRTKLKNCLFANSDLSFFKFERCEFLNCHFLDTDLQRVNFQQCTFVDTKFEGVSNIDKSYFDECEFNKSSKESIVIANPNAKFSTKSFDS